MAYTRSRGGLYLGCYRGPDGREQYADGGPFTSKRAAKAAAEEEEAKLRHGRWLDPSGQRMTFGAYAAQWRELQQLRVTTLEQVDSHLRAHLLPRWGDRAMASIVRSEVQAWVNELAAKLAPATVDVVYGRFVTIMRSAVDDRMIASHPCTKIKRPKVPKRRALPMTAEQVETSIPALPERAQIVPILSAGAGLREGEALGLCVERVDWLRRVARIDQQLVTVTGRAPFLAPPKTEASEREVPLSDFVLDALAAHLARFPATTTLETVTGEPGHLIVTDAGGNPYRRNRWGETWQGAVAESGLPLGTRFHGYRHYFVSVLIDAGATAKQIQETVGHTSIRETYDTYGHLMEKAEDRTRAAVDQAFADFPRTATTLKGL